MTMESRDIGSFPSWITQITVDLVFGGSLKVVFQMVYKSSDICLYSNKIKGKYWGKDRKCQSKAQNLAALGNMSKAWLTQS